MLLPNSRSERVEAHGRSSAYSRGSNRRDWIRVRERSEASIAAATCGICVPPAPRLSRPDEIARTERKLAEVDFADSKIRMTELSVVIRKECRETGTRSLPEGTAVCREWKAIDLHILYLPKSSSLRFSSHGFSSLSEASSPGALALEALKTASSTKIGQSMRRASANASLGRESIETSPRRGLPR